MGNEKELDAYVMCEKCATLHTKIELKKSQKAYCSSCGNKMYGYHEGLVSKGVSLSFTALILFILANLFPLVQIEVLGYDNHITILKTIRNLFEANFVIIALMCALLFLIIPFTVFATFFLFFLSLQFKFSPPFSRKLLIFLHYLKPWSMADIFLISILISLVKLLDMVHLHIGISFWALFLYVLVDVYLLRAIHTHELWDVRDSVFFKQEGVHAE